MDKATVSAVKDFAVHLTREGVDTLRTVSARGHVDASWSLNERMCFLVKYPYGSSPSQALFHTLVI